MSMLMWMIVAAAAACVSLVWAAAGRNAGVVVPQALPTHSSAAVVASGVALMGLRHASTSVASASSNSAAWEEWCTRCDQLTSTLQDFLALQGRLMVCAVG
jgi:hypothetical protein